MEMRFFEKNLLNQLLNQLESTDSGTLLPFFRLVRLTRTLPSRPAS